MGITRWTKNLREPFGYAKCAGGKMILFNLPTTIIRAGRITGALIRQESFFATRELAIQNAKAARPVVMKCLGEIKTLAIFKFRHSAPN